MRMSLIICLLVVFQSGYGQTNRKQDVAAELQKLADLYKKSTRLSFDITYRYAAAEQPATWLDSLSGHCKLSGEKYWYDINDIESIKTGEYVILLFKEDEVMYLAKPTAATADAGLNSAAMANPAGQLDNFLKNDTAINCHVTEEKTHRKITIDFTKPGIYKRVEFYVNRKTGFLDKMVNWVKSDQLYDASVRSLVDAGDSYAVVEAIYTNYSQEGFDDTLFSTGQYFKKEDGEFVTVAPYQTYKIFQGTPNL